MSNHKLPTEVLIKLEYDPESSEGVKVSRYEPSNNNKMASIQIDRRSSDWQSLHRTLIENGYTVETEIIGDFIYFTWES